MVNYSPAEYNGKSIPGWAEFLGWLMVVAPIVCIIARALKMLLYKRIPVKILIEINQYNMQVVLLTCA